MLTCDNIIPSSLENIVKLGNEAYSNQNFEKAISYYQAVIDSGYVSADLYYNLGNAHFKTHQIPRAILYYEKAKLLAPNDEDVQYNLELANTHVVDKIEQLPGIAIVGWWRNFKRSLSPTTWALIGIICFVVFLALMGFYLFSTRVVIKRWTFWTAFLIFIISIFAVGFAFNQKNNITLNNQAIILSPSVTIKGSPGENSTDLFVLHGGTKVKVEDRVGEWYEIKLADGSKGWIPMEDLEKIYNL